MAKRTKQTIPGQGQIVTIKIPVGELSDGHEYQISKRGAPRQIRSRRLTVEQGRALGMIRLGMINRGERLNAEQVDFYSGDRREKPVESTGEVISRILEYVANAVEEKCHGEET